MAFFFQCKITLHALENAMFCFWTFEQQKAAKLFSQADFLIIFVPDIFFHKCKTIRQFLKT